MKCPVCGKEMVTENFGVNVNVCENGCKGIWFDQGELAMLDEKNEGLGAALEAALRYPRHNDGQRGQIKCPKCGIGDLAERRTKKGRTFYGCLRYPDCDYSTWNKPVAVACPSCGFVGMEELKSKTTGETTRKCLKCGHEIKLEESAPEAEEVAP